MLINTTLERQKGRNMLGDPRVTVLVVDPQHSKRWVEIRGHVIDMTQAGAVDHADKLTRLYCSGEKTHFYGDIYPVK